MAVDDPDTRREVGPIKHDQVIHWRPHSLRAKHTGIPSPATSSAACLPGVSVIADLRSGAESVLRTASRVAPWDTCGLCGRDWHARGCPVAVTRGLVGFLVLVTVQFIFMVATLVQHWARLDFGLAAFALLLMDGLWLWFASAPWPEEQAAGHFV